MPMRMSGLISGLDTDTIVSQLVKAKRDKVDKAKGEQTKLGWKQDKWKELNKQLVSLRSTASNLRWSSSWNKKTTSVSDSTKASVITGDGATDSVQSLKITQLAKSGYLTGAQIKAVDEDGNPTGGKLTALSKMSDLGFTGDTSFSLTTNGKTKEISINADSSISDVLSALKKEGLNASFDERNQRFFISSKTTGEESDFKLTSNDAEGAAALKALGLTDGARKIDGQNAKIELNGAEFESSSNVFEINGLTITALAETGENEEITLTTSNDTSGLYDQIKEFLKTYNGIINELDKIYNAASSSKYVPLTDEQKEALSESEVEKYEDKIKDGLFKGDDTASSLISALTSSMAKGFEVGGKKMYLSDFGINTLSYFEAEKNESHAFHIDGDSDDEKTSGKADRLKSLIASDPSQVSGFFTKLSNELYKSLDKLSSRVAGKRTYGTFYNDQTMTADNTGFDSKIKELEDKANEYEDKLYSKFSKMEATMAKLQSKTTALAGLFGGTQ